MNEFDTFANEVVGPIRASILRKNAIREELLSHLNETADCAREKGTASEELAAHVLERFGDAATVRGEIEASVPAWQRVLFIRMLDRRETEGDYRYAARMSSYISLLIAGFVVLNVASCWMKKGFTFDAYLWLLAAPLGVFVFLLGEFVLDMRIRRSVQQGHWRTAFIQAVLNGAALGLVPVAASIAADSVAPGMPYVLTTGALVGVGLFVMMVPTSLGAAYWATRNCPWIEDLGRNI